MYMFFLLPEDGSWATGAARAQHYKQVAPLVGKQETRMKGINAVFPPSHAPLYPHSCAPFASPMCYACYADYM